MFSYPDFGMADPYPDNSTGLGLLSIYDEPEEAAVVEEEEPDLLKQLTQEEADNTDALLIEALDDDYVFFGFPPEWPASPEITNGET